DPGESSRLGRSADAPTLPAFVQHCWARPDGMVLTEADMTEDKDTRIAALKAQLAAQLAAERAGRRENRMTKWETPPEAVWVWGKYGKYAETYCHAEEIKQEEF